MTRGKTEGPEQNDQRSRPPGLGAPGTPFAPAASRRENAPRPLEAARERQMIGWWILPSCALGLVFWVSLIRWLLR